MSSLFCVWKQVFPVVCQTWGRFWWHLSCTPHSGSSPVEMQVWRPFARQVETVLWSWTEWREFNTNYIKEQLQSIPSYFILKLILETCEPSLCSYFIAVWYVTLKNAADVLNIQSCTWLLLESHGVTQHKWQQLSLTTVFHWICAKLPTKKRITSRPEVIKRRSLNSTIILLNLHLCGETSACRSWHGFAGHATHEDGVDGVEETGFSSTYRTDHQDSKTADRCHQGFISPDHFHELVSLSTTQITFYSCIWNYNEQMSKENQKLSRNILSCPQNIPPWLLFSTDLRACENIK